MNPRDRLQTANFTNNQPAIFGEDGRNYSCLHEVSPGMKTVVIINHMDRQFFITRTRDLKVYMRNVASFFSGYNQHVGTVDLFKARNDKNIGFWSAEILDPKQYTIAAIRAKFGAGWWELGSKAHRLRLGGSDLVVYKITHKRTGWSRYASHRVGVSTTPSYIATQALTGLISRCRKNTSLKSHIREKVEMFYRMIKEDFEMYSDSFEVKNMKTIAKEEEMERPSDLIKEMNIALQAEWEGSTYYKRLVGTND